jgi:hypothetical protein
MDMKISTSQTDTSSVEAYDSGQRTLVEKAVGVAATLVDKFAFGPKLCWALKTQVIERWMTETFPEIVEKLEAEHAYGAFRDRLDAYLEVLRSASLQAERVVEYGSRDSLADEQSDHGMFSGLVSRVATGTIGSLDEEALLTSLLIDRYRRLGYGHRYSLQSVAPHSEVWLPKEAWRWCDIAKARATPTDIAYLLPREHLPPDALTYTDEEYALVINVPTTVALASLVAPRGLDAINISTPDGRQERSLMLASCPFLIPMRANEDTLSLFRNDLPVLYLHEDGGLLVEYPWAPVMDFDEFLFPDVDWDWDMPEMSPGTEDEFCDLQDFKAAHADMVRISEIRPFPLLVGPYLPWPRRIRLLAEKESIPF